MKRAILFFIPLILILTVVMGCSSTGISAVDKAAIISASNLISAIGNVNKNSGPKIEAAEKAFNNLDIKLQEKVKNAQVLMYAKVAYNNIFYANEVMKLINDIGLVSIDSKTSIDMAYALYDSLTYEQKALVSNFDLLKAKKDSFDQLSTKESDNKRRADEVISAISKIGDVTINSEPSVDLAFKKYNTLTDEQKALVNNFELLTQAEESLNKLVADSAIKAIDSIGVVTVESKEKILAAQKAYNSLNPEQKTFVINLDKFQLSKDEFSKLEIDKVIGLIDIIRKVDLNSLPVIEAAKKAYDALTPAQKALTTNYAIIEKSIKDYSDTQVNIVIKNIDSIGYVNLEKKPKVIEARALYEKLDSGQKQEVTNYALLESMEQTVTGLEVAQVDRLIAGLNVNYLSQYDLDNSNKVYELYMKLPEAAQKEVENFDKYRQVNDLFADYLGAKNNAAYGNYEEAYNMMVTLNVMDSKQLAREYEKIAFKWWVEGEMTKSSYTRDEFFQIDFTVYGGKPNEKANIVVTCRLPGVGDTTEMLRDVSDGDGYWYKCWHPRPDNASQGIGKMIFKNNSTGEVLGEFEFTVTYK